MTFIQPHKPSSLENIILGVLVVVLLLGTFWLVVLYNGVVNLNHDITADRATLDSIGAQNTTLSNQTMASLGLAESSNIASADGLVTDNNPQYFTESNEAPVVAIGN